MIAVGATLSIASFQGATQICAEQLALRMQGCILLVDIAADGCYDGTGLACRTTDCRLLVVEGNARAC